MKNEIPTSYKKFFIRFAELNTVPPAQWSSVHIIAYFCKKYKEHYGIEYTFDFKNSPSKSTETFQINRLVSMLSSNGEIIKNYIDWIFETQVQQRKRRITSIGFLATVKIVADWKFKFLSQSSKLDRTTLLSPKYLQICEQFSVPISTYGEVAFIKGMIENKTADQNQIKLFSSLGENGFNFSILETIK